MGWMRIERRCFEYEKEMLMVVNEADLSFRIYDPVLHDPLE